MLINLVTAICAILGAIAKWALFVERGGNTAYHALGPLEATAMNHAERGYMSAAQDMRNILADAGVEATDEAIEVYLRDGDMTQLRKAMMLPPKQGEVIEQETKEKES